MQKLYEINFKTLMKHTKDLCKWKICHFLDKKDLNKIYQFSLSYLKNLI